VKVLGLRGWSGSGKTTLLVRLVPELVAHGITVSTVKHAHHQFDLDREGKDSFRHRAAGATEVMISSASRWALLHETREEGETPLPALLARMSPVDLVLVEGYKTAPHDKIEVWRAATGQKLLAAEDAHVVAIATDRPEELKPPRGLPVLPLDDVGAVAAFVVRHCGLVAR